MIHLEGREASKVVKSCDTCKHDEAFGCPSFIHDRCENYSEWEQADREYFCEDYSCIEIEKNCENCEYVSPSESNDNVCRNCDNKSNWKLKQAQADGDLTTALCSLPKIISEDGQDYVQLADVLETVRGYLGDCISKTEAIKTIQQHGVGCFDADDFTPEQCERYVIKLLQDLKPSVAIPSAEPQIGHWVLGLCDNCGYDWNKDAPIASVPNFCPNCGFRML